MNLFEAFPVAITRWRLCAVFLALAVLGGCTEAAAEQPWQIHSVRSDSGGTPVGILALGTSVRVGESGVEFSLGGASLSRDAEVTRTDTGVVIEMDVNGKSVAIEFVQLDEEHSELHWTAGGHAVVAELSRGGKE